MNRAARAFLERRKQSDSEEAKKVTTVLDAKSLSIVERWRSSGDSIKKTVEELLVVADETLSSAAKADKQET